MDELINTIQKVLNQGETDLVLGWKINDRTGTAVPARFYSAEEAGAAVFDATCVHNLAVYLPRLKDKKVGIVVKACDSRSVVQLIAEHEVNHESVTVIGVTCSPGGMLDVKSIWRQAGYGVEIQHGGTVTAGGQQLEREAVSLNKCLACDGAQPVIHDELVGAPGGEAVSKPAESSALEREFAALDAAGRRDFWREQFSRCVRCYACREACPMCFCRDVCTMQTADPRWVGGEIDARSSEMAQLIRINHLAGRCTGCGECERACPVDIPLMLLLNEQNRVIEEMFDYRAGLDPEARPPLLAFDINNDSWGGG